MLVDPSQETPHVHGEDRTNARAGTARRGFQKHPHVRGEDCRPMKMIFGHKETPPRAWGRHIAIWDESYIEGNTPTCVGKTPGPGQLSDLVRKHPHVRGEDRHSLRT